MAAHPSPLSLDMPVKGHGTTSLESTKVVQSYAAVEDSAAVNFLGEYRSEQTFGASNLSPVVSLATSIKSQPNSKKTLLKSNLGPEPIVRAIQTAVHSHIPSPLNAAALVNGPKVRNVGHVVGSSGSPVKSPLPAGGPAQGEAHANRHYIQTAEINPVLSPIASTPVSPSSPTETALPSVETTLTEAEVKISENMNGGPYLSTEFCLLQGTEVAVSSDAPQEEVQGDDFGRLLDAGSEMITETKAAPDSLETKHPTQVVLESPSCLLNLEKIETDVTYVDDNQSAIDGAINGRFGKTYCCKRKP